MDRENDEIIINDDSSIEENSKEIEEIKMNIANALQDVFANFGLGSLQDIKSAVNQNDLQKLLSILKKMEKDGTFYFASKETCKQIYHFIKPIPGSSYTGDNKKKFLKYKFTLAGKTGEFGGLYDETATYLDEFASEDTDEVINSLILLQANAAAQEGKNELAYSLYKKIISNPNSHHNLAWAYRGLSLILGPTNPDAVYYEEKAADFFLLAGNSVQYASSKIGLANIVKNSTPNKALKYFDEALEIFNEKDSSSIKYIASIKLEKSKLLDLIGHTKDAFNESQQTYKLLNSTKNIYGNEMISISILKVMFIYGKKISAENTNSVSNYELKLEQLERKLLNKDKNEYKLSEQLLQSLDKKDMLILKEIKSDVLSLGKDTMIILYYLIEYLISDFTLLEKFEHLENLNNIAREKNVSSDIKALICELFAINYLDISDETKAIEWYKKTLDNNPFSWSSRQNYLSLLWKKEYWCEAVSFLENQLNLLGELPFLLFALGKSLVESGEYARAIPILRKAQIKAPEEDIISEYLSKAIDLCKDFSIPSIHDSMHRNISDISKNDFEQCIQCFIEYIQSEVRMTFWKKKSSKKHSWTTSPEQHGQTLFHTFIKSRYGTSVDVIEELSTGAGRIDLFVKFKNGFQAILELKMCGNGYSLSYSLEGLRQLNHYLQNKHVHLGYLVIFDSRTRDFSQGIEPRYYIENNLIYSYTADVRPTVKQ